tara:strand:+ start:608 stop:1600 length:993 start_codon:yes stop_codon:yes gene_type:complete
MKDTIFSLILIVIYLICTVKHNKEYLTVNPSDIKMTFYETIPEYFNDSEIIISKKKFNHPNYFKHTNNKIYINKLFENNYHSNYKYKNQIYKDDFRWKYVGIFVIKEFDDYSREWLRNNLRSSPFLYKIIYIHSDLANLNNKKVFPFLEYGCTLVIYGLKPYKRYSLERTHIITPNELAINPIVKKETKNPYIKIYIDKFKLVGIVKDGSEIIDNFELSSKLETILKKEEDKSEPKMDQYTMKMKGIPRFETFYTKWYDDVFDEWYQMILVELNQTIDTKKISLKKRQLPVHYMNYLYLLHRNHPKEITTNNILSQITTDMNLPITKILK